MKSDGGSCSTDDEVKCPVCSRCFRSLKAMHGHMRCHPERGWRGVNPPPPPSTGPDAPSSPVSSLTWIDVLPDESRPLKKRRYALFPEEETETLTLTLTLALPLLPVDSKNVNSDNSSGSFSNYIISSDKKGIEEKQLQDRKIELVRKEAFCSSGLKGQEGSERKSDDSWKNFLRLGLINCGADEVGSKTVKDKEAVEQQVGHKCRTCGKVFATGQALGGHQTIHRGKSVKHPEESGQNAARLGVLNFDLNELPPEFSGGMVDD